MISREQAENARRACQVLPEGAAFTAGTMLDVLDSYMAAMDALSTFLDEIQRCDSGWHDLEAGRSSKMREFLDDAGWCTCHKSSGRKCPDC